MESKKILKIILIFVIAIVLVDQISKILVDNFMPEETIVLQNVLSITKYENEGVAFGINNQNISNIALILLVLAII